MIKTLLTSIFISLLLISCQAAKTLTELKPTEAPIGQPTATKPDDSRLAPGCAEGGIGVHTADDVRCLLKQFEPDGVLYLSDDLGVIFSSNKSMAMWVSGAILYHAPSVSTLHFDFCGDYNPSRSHINSAEAENQFLKLLENRDLLAEIRQRVADEWGQRGIPCN